MCLVIAGACIGGVIAANATLAPWAPLVGCNRPIVVRILSIIGAVLFLGATRGFALALMESMRTGLK